MAYEKQTWIDGDASTPLSADRLNHIEEGLAAVSELQAHFTPVDLTWDERLSDELDPIWALGSGVIVEQHVGRVSIAIRGPAEELIRALDGLELLHFPAPRSSGHVPCDVELFQGAKFLTKMGGVTLVSGWERDLKFVVAADAVLAAVQEVGADRMTLSTSYYTEELPPRDLLP